MKISHYFICFTHFKLFNKVWYYCKNLKSLHFVNYFNKYDTFIDVEYCNQAHTDKTPLFDEKIVK